MFICPECGKVCESSLTQCPKCNSLKNKSLHDFNLIDVLTDKVSRFLEY